MWKRRRTWMLLLALVVVTPAVMYEYTTHVGRGWLFGEAVYQDRPTSYWRSRCDVWLERFDSPSDAARYVPPWVAMPILPGDDLPGKSVTIRPIQRSFWISLLRQIGLHDQPNEDWPPAVLRGDPGSEPVLEELAREERYRLLAERSLKYAEIYRSMRQTQ